MGEEGATPCVWGAGLVNWKQVQSANNQLLRRTTCAPGRGVWLLLGAWWHTTDRLRKARSRGRGGGPLAAGRARTGTAPPQCRAHTVTPCSRVQPCMQPPHPAHVQACLVPAVHQPVPRLWPRLPRLGHRGEPPPIVAAGWLTARRRARTCVRRPCRTHARVCACALAAGLWRLSPLPRWPCMLPCARAGSRPAFKLGGWLATYHHRAALAKPHVASPHRPRCCRRSAG